jgi:hypothetical protein
VSAAKDERYIFEQLTEDTPFAGFLRSARTEIALEPEDGSTKVTLAADHRLRGLSRLGAPMMRRATGRTLAEALRGLERALTGAPS